MACGCAERRAKIRGAAQAALERVKELFGTTVEETEEDDVSKDRG